MRYLGIFGHVEMFLYYQDKISNSAVILLPKQCVYGDAITDSVLVIADCYLKGNAIAYPPPVPLRGRHGSGYRQNNC